MLSLNSDITVVNGYRPNILKDAIHGITFKLNTLPLSLLIPMSASALCHIHALLSVNEY